MHDAGHSCACLSVPSLAQPRSQGLRCLCLCCVFVWVCEVAFACPSGLSPPLQFAFPTFPLTRPCTPHTRTQMASKQHQDNDQEEEEEDEGPPELVALPLPSSFSPNKPLSSASTAPAKDEEEANQPLSRSSTGPSTKIGRAHV